MQGGRCSAAGCPCVLDDGAVVAVVRRKVIRFGFECEQVGPEGDQLADAPIDIGDLGVEHREHVIAGSLATLLERQNLSDLGQREPESLGGLDLIVTPLGVSKWTGIETYCQMHDIAPEEVLAVGDGLNDLPMLNRTRRSWALGTTARSAHQDQIAAVLSLQGAPRSTPGQRTRRPPTCGP